MVSDLIILVIILPIIIFTVFLGFFLVKKTVKKPTFLIVGWRKKNRVVLRDERLISAYWKMNNRISWIAGEIAVILGLTAAFHNNIPLVLGILAMGMAVLIVLTAIWYKSLARFNKLKNELGVAPEHDERVIKTATEELMKDANTHSNLISFTALSLILFVIGFIQNNLLICILSGFSTIYLIITIIRVKKKHANSNLGDDGNRPV